MKLASVLLLATLIAAPAQAADATGWAEFAQCKGWNKMPAEHKGFMLWGVAQGIVATDTLNEMKGGKPRENIAMFWIGETRTMVDIIGAMDALCKVPMNEERMVVDMMIFATQNLKR